MFIACVVFYGIKIATVYLISGEEKSWPERLTCGVARHAEYFFTQYDLKENALVAIHALRREICYTLDGIRSGKLIEDVSDWSPAGLAALALPLEHFN